MKLVPNFNKRKIDEDAFNHSKYTFLMILLIENIWRVFLNTLSKIFHCTLEKYHGKPVKSSREIINLEKKHVSQLSHMLLLLF